MTDSIADLLHQFASGPAIEDRWTAARQLMAAKKLAKAVGTPMLDAGFDALGVEAKNGEGLNRLLSVDLLVRLPSFVKKLKPKANELLTKALTRELPPLSLVKGTKGLPAEAKPAEIRENVAYALTYAPDQWILPYVLRALTEEDRSQRCRLELVRQLAARDKSIGGWLSQMAEQPALENLSRTAGIDNAVSRLRDLAAALAEVIRKDRVQLTASVAAGLALARLCQRTVQLSPRASVPARLDVAASEVTALLDELLAARLTLIAEPDAYAILDIFRKWWEPLRYPDSLNIALLPILDKLLTAITLRARMGQRSEQLVLRLRQAMADPQEVEQELAQLADGETGLSPEIDDWLRGRKRTTSPATEALRRALQSVSQEEATVSIAPLLLEADEALASIDSGSTEDLADHIRRLSTGIKSITSQRGLEIVGLPGDVVEFSASAHQTTSGILPAEPRVRIVRPMVVRRRKGGGQDILVKALVTDI